MSISAISCGPRYRPSKDAGPVIMVFCNKDKTEAEYSWNREVISGVYYAKGEFGGRYIYEKSVEDPNKMWWSLRFDVENNRWISSYSDSKIVIGNEKFGSTIGLFSLDSRGEFKDHESLSFFQFITFSHVEGYMSATGRYKLLSSIFDKA